MTSVCTHRAARAQQAHHGSHRTGKQGSCAPTLPRRDSRGGARPARLCRSGCRPLSAAACLQVRLDWLSGIQQAAALLGPALLAGAPAAAALLGRCNLQLAPAAALLLAGRGSGGSRQRAGACGAAASGGVCALLRCNLAAVPTVCGSLAGQS